jgi:hypothetical protein
MSGSLTWAEVKVPQDCRIKNRPPGRCGWCALETLARLHAFKCLYGLSESHATMCSAVHLEDALTGTGITYRIQYPGDYSEAILRYAVREQLGAVVGFREIVPGAGGHIVTLVDFTEDMVKVIDSNDPDCKTRTMSLDRFLYWWDGFALVLEEDPATRPAMAKAPERQPSTEPKYGR